MPTLTTSDSSPTSSSLMATLVQAQRNYFESGATQSLDFRLAQLNKLKKMLDDYYPEIVQALYLDLHKPETEVVLGELLLLKEEIKTARLSLKKWVKPVRVPSPFPACWPGKSSITPEPYGVCLIIAPWNYPIQISLSPLVGAIAAGNCVVLKPSEISSHSQALIAKMIKATFEAQYVSVVEGGVAEVQALLKERFDYLFFTGGASIAKQVMAAASHFLTPVTFELGGKSPCIVDETAQIEYAARRIMWSKWMNAGQTCVAPDYVYVHESVKSIFIEKCHYYTERFYGADPKLSKDYPRIVNQRHFARLMNLIKTGRLLSKHVPDEAECYIPPILMDEVKWEDPVMQEEIFGPLLPIFSYQKLDDVITQIRSQPKALALYLFTQSPATEKRILSELSFGGGCINDCTVQLANSALPFGGVGSSGMGRYHGKYTFDTFSHQKSLFKRTWPIDIWLQYPPYSSKKLTWLKRLLRW